MNDETSRFNPNDISANKDIACLSYLWILFIIPMLIKKESPFTKFHVNQGLAFFIVSTIMAPIGMALDFIPLFGWLLRALINLVLLAIMIAGIVNALQGKAKRLPIIGNIQLYK